METNKELSAEELSTVTGGNEIYVVQKGDNLVKIAEKYGISWKKLYAKNRDRLKDPVMIKPGMELVIPIL